MKSITPLTIILILTALACSPEKPASGPIKTYFSGSVQGIADTTLQFTFEQYSLLSGSQNLDIIVDNEGKFNLILDTENPLKGSLSFGKIPKTYKFDFITIHGNDTSMQVGSVDFRIVLIYLEPGDSLNMKVDAGNIRETLEFSGSGSDNNFFINNEDWEFNDYKSKYLNNYYHITYLQPNSYKKTKQDQYDNKIQFLRHFSSDKELSENLVRLYKNQYEHEVIQRVISYPGSNAGFNKGQYPELPADYYNFLDSVNLQVDLDHSGIASYYYINSVLHKKYELAATGSGSDPDFYDFARGQLPDRLGYIFMAYSLDRDFHKKLYDEFDESCPYPDIAAIVKKKYGHLEGMLEGSPGPEFALRDINGSIYRLEDFRGNLVYIDFWATWCKPCIKEIPYLEELQTEYQDREIKFISISIDSEKDTLKWKKFVLENDLKGIQLWADEDHQDMFSRNLNIKSIPRFVLLDKDGRIIDARAPRPSDPDLKKILEEL